MNSENPYESPLSAAARAVPSHFRFGGSRLYLVAIVWAAFVLLTGFYADNGRYSWPHGVISAVMALVSIVCLAVSLRGWKHLLALPLYLFFACELLVFATLFVGRPAAHPKISRSIQENFRGLDDRELTAPAGNHSTITMDCGTAEYGYIRVRCC